VGQFTNISWHPTIRALWSPRGQQVMIPTPMQPTRRYGLGAANWHTGETVVLIRRRKRRREIAELLQALVDKHPHERVDVAWDNSGTHAQGAARTTRLRPSSAGPPGGSCCSTCRRTARG
jgi:hypothetical protein